MIGHDQASGAGPHRFLDEPIERTAQLHQAGREDLLAIRRGVQAGLEAELPPPPAARHAALLAAGRTARFANSRLCIGLLFAIAISGCGSNTKRDIGACATAAASALPQEAAKNYMSPTIDWFIRNCMKAKGYEYNKDRQGCLGFPTFEECYKPPSLFSN
jgi:hypothetical protein